MSTRLRFDVTLLYASACHALGHGAISDALVLTMSSQNLSFLTEAVNVDDVGFLPCSTFSMRADHNSCLGIGGWRHGRLCARGMLNFRQMPRKHVRRILVFERAFPTSYLLTQPSPRLYSPHLLHLNNSTANGHGCPIHIGNSVWSR